MRECGQDAGGGDEVGGNVLENYPSSPLLQPAYCGESVSPLAQMVDATSRMSADCQLLCPTMLSKDSCLLYPRGSDV
jgi:hypothetical protein